MQCLDDHIASITKAITLITKKFGRKNCGREIIGCEIFGRFFSKFRTKFRTKSHKVISKNLQNLGRKYGNEALKRIKMNELGRLLVVEIVKSKFHQIKKKIIKKKRIWWQKISKSLTRNIHYFYFLCERALEKIRTAKISDG